MKRILIYNVAAESGGALSILDYYHEKYVNNDTLESWFLLSVVHYDNKQEHVHIINVPWVKKSWFHRLFCDIFYVNKFIEKNSIDEVISLQNIGIPFCKKKQTVYVQNAIPFTEYKFGIIKSPFLWFYQNVIGRITYLSLKKVDKIIVQTNWMKKEIISRCNCDAEKIVVEKVKSKYPICCERIKSSIPTFFYPASAFEFKNHSIILSACKKLKDRGIISYQVYFTLSENDNKLSKKILGIAEEYKLPIIYTGLLDKNEMEKKYKSSVLIFPSYLETVGLPLIEAQSFHSYILAADYLYAHDALSGYENMTFFSTNDDGEELANLMEKFIISFS